VGAGLTQHFEGSAGKLVEAAQKSAGRLVDLVTTHFPGFRDSCVWRGQEVFFYKRAQIFVGAPPTPRHRVAAEYLVQPTARSPTTRPPLRDVAAPK
jgi:hypothetical protein